MANTENLQDLILNEAVSYTHLTLPTMSCV